MRCSTCVRSLLAVFFLFPDLGVALAEEKHVFYGEITSVEPAAKTFAIKSTGGVLVFHYSEATRLSSFSGYVRWDKLKPGEAARVTMHVGEGNVGIADEVRIERDMGLAKMLSLFRARTVKGEIVSGVALANYVASEPKDEPFSRAAADYKPGDQGVFVLAIRPDGSVGQVTAAKSFTDPELNERAAGYLRRWRFKPGTVTQVQMPLTYNRVR